MADTGTGIQELMAAETRASQIVAEARIGKTLVILSVDDAGDGCDLSLAALDAISSTIFRRPDVLFRDTSIAKLFPLSPESDPC